MAGTVAWGPCRGPPTPPSASRTRGCGPGGRSRARTRAGSRSSCAAATAHVLFVRHTYGDRQVWELPGGGLRRREVPQDGAAREAREELGLDLAWRGLGLVETGGEGKTTTIHVFAAELPAGGEVTPDARELAEVRWAPPSAPPFPLGRDAPPVLGLL